MIEVKLHELVLLALLCFVIGLLMQMCGQAAGGVV